RFATIDDPKGESDAWCETGRALFEKGELARAEARYDKAIERARSIGDRRGEAEALYEKGRAASRAGRVADARGRFKQSLGLGPDVGDRDIESRARLELAELAAGEGDVRGAEREFLEKARARSLAHPGSSLSVRYELAKGTILRAKAKH